MAGCPIIRLVKHKTASSLIGAMGHHARTIPTRNADPARLCENQTIWGAEDPAEVVRRVMARTDPLAKRKDAVRAVELFLGASDDFWEAGGDWQLLARAHLAMLRREFGDDNIIGCGLHLDERRPHLWAIVTPVTPDARLSAAHWFDGPKKIAALLDRAQGNFARLGMERARRGVKATHIDMQTLQQAAAGNARAQRRVQRELARREKAALEASQVAEAKAAKAIAEAEQARAAATKVVMQLAVMETRIKGIQARAQKLDAVEALQARQASELNAFARRLSRVQGAIVEALRLLPAAVADKIEAVWGPLRKAEAEVHAEVPATARSSGSLTSPWT